MKTLNPIYEPPKDKYKKFLLYGLSLKKFDEIIAASRTM